MKKTKIIIPALAVLLLSTAASVTGTVAWFSMNNNVTATGMNIKAKAENGIVISNAAAANGTWADSATAAHNAALEVYPTSTKDGSTWCHSASNDADDATSNGTYSMLTLADDATTGAGYVNNNGVEGYQTTEGTGEYVGKFDEAYYLKNSFYIKSSAEAMTKAFYINQISVSGNTNSPEFDKCLRVLIIQSSTKMVFAPITGADTTYSAWTGSQSEAVTVVAPGTKNTVWNASLAIPARSSDPLQFDVYLYYEGEDENCKSTNLTATLSTLAVTIQFGTATIA